MFGANSAWVLCAAIAHNLLRATGILAGGSHARARAATLRRKIVNIPARNADRSCTYPATGPGPTHGSCCGTTLSATHHHNPSPPDRPGPTARTNIEVEKLGRPTRNLGRWIEAKSANL